MIPPSRGLFCVIDTLRGPEPLARERCMCERSGGSERNRRPPNGGRLGHCSASGVNLHFKVEGGGQSSFNNFNKNTYFSWPQVGLAFGSCFRSYQE